MFPHKNTSLIKNLNIRVVLFIPPGLKKVYFSSLKQLLNQEAKFVAQGLNLTGKGRLHPSVYIEGSE